MIIKEETYVLLATTIESVYTNGIILSLVIGIGVNGKVITLFKLLPKSIKFSSAFFQLSL